MIETAFVTGGSSTLGQHVLRRLMSHFRVLAVVHLHNVEKGPEREAVRGGFSPLRWWRARQERRKLEELWRRSNEQDNQGS